MVKFLENMGCISVCLVFGLICAVRYSLSSGVTKGDYLPFSDKPLPSATPEPIDIDTQKAKEIHTDPLISSLATTEVGNLTNSGTSVTVILKSLLTSDYVTKGTVFHNVYTYARMKYYFTNETNKIAGSSFNKKGGQKLETSTQWYNVDYGSFENALRYRNGIMEIRTPIMVLEGKERNKDFDLLAPYLKNITKSGSSIEVPLYLTNQFFNKYYPEDVEYFAYPGAFTNETTNEETYCTTTIVIPPSPNIYITTQQHAVFLEMRNKEGKQLDTSATQKPVNNRPIVKTRGIRQIRQTYIKYHSIPGLGKF